MGDLKRKVEILQEQAETLERGMAKLHFQMVKAGYDPGDDLYLLAGYELEILIEILTKAEKTIDKGVPNEQV